jgi:hypothetical protein
MMKLMIFSDDGETKKNYFLTMAKLIKKSFLTMAKLKKYIFSRWRN